MNREKMFQKKSKFYLIVSIVLLTIGMFFLKYEKSSFALVSFLLVLGFGSMSFLNFLEKIKENKINRLLAIKNFIESKTLNRSENFKEILVYFLFLIDVKHFRVFKKSFTQIYWFNKDKKPFSNFVEKILNIEVNDSIIYKLSEKEESFLLDNLDLLENQKDLIKELTIQMDLNRTEENSVIILGLK